MDFIPQIEPWIDDTELEELTGVIKSTFITENEKTEEFLERVRKLTGSPQAIATSNGTLAIVSALMAAGIGPGEEVIIPDLTFIASSNAVIMVGATPVFCDVRRDTGCMDLASARACITPRTKALMPVHLYGQTVEMDDLMAMAEEHGLMVIEDAAESFGITYKDRHTGTFGRFGTFSFFANKTITCGEGGVVLCQTEEDYRNLYRIKNHGRDRKGIFIHENIGFNFCFSDLQAAVGVAQMRKFERIMEGKQRNFDFYMEHLHCTSGIEVIRPPEYVRSNHWFVNILVEDPHALSAFLQDNGVGTRRLFYPMHRQPCYSHLDTQPRENANWLYEHGLSLPSGPRLSDEERQRVCDLVLEFNG